MQQINKKQKKLCDSKETPYINFLDITQVRKFSIDDYNGNLVIIEKIRFSVYLLQN